MPDQIEFIANTVRLYRDEAVESEAGSKDLMKQNFPKSKYVDVSGFCKATNLSEIEKQDWSLNPGRYVGVADRASDDFEFLERLEELNEELEILNTNARQLEEKVAENIAQLLESERA
jgi:type I restriction enzyme M protein